MEIRIAGDDDLDALVALRLCFLAEVGDEPDLTADAELTRATAAFFATQMAAGTVRTWLAEIEGALVGLVSVLVHAVPPMPEDPRTASGFVVNVWVDPAHRRRGIARALMVRAADDVDDLGLRRLALDTTDAGRPLCESLGYAPNPFELARPLAPPAR